MNKQILIDTAKKVIKERSPFNDINCLSFDNCKNCPASWINNSDSVSCLVSKRYKINWLQNWLKENDTTETNGVVISRELLDESIEAIRLLNSLATFTLTDHEYERHENLQEKLIKLRGEK